MRHRRFAFVPAIFPNPGITHVTSAHVLGRCRAGRAHWLVIKPLLVETIQRLPHRTIESTVPSPGTVSPRAAFQTPLGPCNTAVPFATSRTTQPSMVVGFVSGNGTGNGFGRRWIAADDAGTVLCGATAAVLVSTSEGTAFCVESRRSPDPFAVGRPLIVPFVDTLGDACRGGSTALGGRVEIGRSEPIEAAF